jgi:hypothetical protein
MNEKKIALKIIENSEKAYTEINLLKEDSLDCLTKLLLLSRDILGEIPSEKSFKKIVARIINEIFVKKYLPFTWRKIITLFNITEKIISAIDKYGLDRLFGESWYEKVRTKALALLEKGVENNIEDKEIIR